MKKTEGKPTVKQLGMFIGSKCILERVGEDVEGILYKVSMSNTISIKIIGSKTITTVYNDTTFKMVLRTMNQLTFEERQILSKMDSISIQSSAEVIAYLCSIGIDVFNWIPQQIAIKDES